MILGVILPLLMEHIINSPRVVGWLGRGFEAQNKLINIGALIITVLAFVILMQSMSNSVLLHGESMLKIINQYNAMIQS